MKELHFSKTYFNKLIVDDINSKLRVVINENPSLEISEEEYSLRILTRYEDGLMINRDYAIEHHLAPAKHSFPHLQFKFHTEEIGQFRIRIDIKDIDEYKRIILGFIFRIKKVLNDLERFRKGITNEVLVLELVDKLEDDGEFLRQKIAESISKYSLEFDKINRDKIRRLKENKLLIDFIGEENLLLIEQKRV